MKHILFALLLLSVATSGQDVTGKPQLINGVYVFILCRPLNEYTYIADIGLLHKDTCITTKAKVLYLIQASKQVAGANAIFIPSLEFDSAAVIHLK